MSYWDTYREIQRLAQQIRPMDDLIRAYLNNQDQIRTYLDNQDRIAKFANGISAIELLRQIDEVQKLAQSPAIELLAARANVAAAIQPFPDLSRLPYDLNAALIEQLGRLSAAFEQAPVVGQFSVEHAEESASTPNAHADIEERLVNVVPAGTLEALRRVEFEPVLLLDRFLRDPQLMRHLSARDFERFIAALVEQLGFEDVTLTPQSGDEGRDVLATKRVHGISILFAIECKRYAPDRPVGPEIARALLGTVMHGSTRAAKGILVTTSHFTPAARTFILTEPALDGKDFDGVVDWLREYGARRRS